MNKVEIKPIDLKKNPYVDSPVNLTKHNSLYIEALDLANETKNDSIEKLKTDFNQLKTDFNQLKTDFDQLHKKQIDQIKDYEKFQNIAKIVKIAGIVLTAISIIAAFIVLAGPIFPAILGLIVAALEILLFIFIIWALSNDPTTNASNVNPAPGIFAPIEWCFAKAPKYIADAIYGTNIAAITGIVTGAVTGVGLLLWGCGKWAEDLYNKKIAEENQKLKLEYNNYLRTKLEF